VTDYTDGSVVIARADEFKK